MRRLVPKNESFLSKRYQKGLFSLVSYALYLCVMKGRELFRLDRFEDSVVFLCYMLHTLRTYEYLHTRVRITINKVY